MAKSRVKGITIQIGGDTMGLDKALKGTNENIYKTQSQLKDVERLLKLDPKNTVLLGQKQRLLASAVGETKSKLDQLTEAHDQAVGNLDKYDAWAHANDKIQDEVNQTRDALKKLEKQKAQLDEAGEVDTDEYQALTAEIEKTSDELKNLKKHQADVREEFGNPLSPEQFDSLQREIIETRLELEKMEQTGKVSLEAIGDKAGKVAKTFKPVTTAVAGLGAAAVATVPATEEIREQLSKLDANAAENAVNADAARAAWKKFAVQSGDVGSAVEATSNLLQAGFTESTLQKAVEGLAGAAIRFPDTLKVESLADSLQETLATGAATGQFAELIERLGLNLDDFNASMAACTTDVERQNLALQTLADAGLHDSYNAWRQNNEELLANKEANLELEMSMAKIAETVLPIVTRATESLADFLDWLAELPEGGKIAIAAILGLLGAISPVAGTVSSVIQILDKMSGVSLPGLGGALGKISGTALPGLGSVFTSVVSFITAHPIVWLIAAIAGLVAFIATEGDEIQKGLENMNTFLKDVFAKDWTEVFGPVLGGIMNNFLDMVEGVWDYLYMTFDGVIDFIRGIFTLDLKRALNGLVKIFAAPINSIISMINQAIDSINWLIEGANNIPGVNIGTIGHIPLLAQNIGRGATTSSTDMDALNVLSSPTVAQNTTSTTNSTSNTTNVGTVSIMLNAGYGQSVHELAEQISEEIQRMVESEEAKL